LQAFYREVHSLAAASGQTEFSRLTQTAAVFEALLYVLIGDPAGLSPSVVRTTANLVDYVELLARNAGESRPAVAPLSTQVLLVDDDPVSNHVAVAALRQAQLNPRSTEDPLVAWQWLHQERFDLVVLDIEMPALMDFSCASGCVACRLRKNARDLRHIHGDFESRAKASQRRRRPDVADPADGIGGESRDASVKKPGAPLTGARPIPIKRRILQAAGTETGLDSVAATTANTTPVGTRFDRLR
jgi:CheY-like chemotaxis protein